MRKLLLIALLAASGCSVPQKRVLAIEKTRTYHTDSCPRVCMARTRTMTLDEAQELRLKACPGCKPDRL